MLLHRAVAGNSLTTFIFDEGYSNHAHLETSDDGHVRISGNIPSLGGEGKDKGKSSGPALQKLDHLPGPNPVDESAIHGQKANAIHREKNTEKEEKSGQAGINRVDDMTALAEDPVNWVSEGKKGTQKLSDGEKMAKVAMAR